MAEAFPLHAVSLEWFLDAEALLRHVLVVGGSGSGKTNTALDIVELALSLGFNVVVFDVKGEYRCLVGSEAFPGGLWLLGVGLSEGRLLVNPLEPPAGVAAGMWMHLFADILTRCYGLSDPSRRILFDCVGHLYRQYRVGAGGREFPGLRELEQAVRRFRAGSPAEANSRRALESRLRILGSGELGRSVVCDFDAPFWEEPQFVALVELKGVVAVRDQQFLVELVVAKLLEARKQNPRLLERPVLVVLEEAHRVLSEARPVSQRGTRSLLELAVAEGRSWGVGFLIVKQSPWLLSHYVVANTGTKLVHLLGAGEDVELMRRVMNLSESEHRLFSELQVGEAMLLALRPFALSGERITSRLRRVRLPYFAGHAASYAAFADHLSHQATQVVDLRRRDIS